MGFQVNASDTLSEKQQFFERNSNTNRGDTLANVTLTLKIWHHHVSVVISNTF